jgi:putative tryptophan/tyrosine transport system substrate-binding protein
MTGVYWFSIEVEAKRLGLLRDLVPTATTMAVLIDATHPDADSQLRDAQQAAARLGVQLVTVRAASERDFETAFATMVERRAAALMVCASPFFTGRRDQLVMLAARHKLPAAYEWREFVVGGGLMSYNNSATDVYRQLGDCAGRILKGAKPADLPVVQPTKFEFVLNLRTAKSLGLTISDNLLTLADEVIE